MTGRTNSEIPRRRPLVAGFLAAAALFWAGTAAAQCKVTANSWDESFGRAPLGEELTSERVRGLKPCVSADQCAFTDDSGIEYTRDEKGILVGKGLGFDKSYAGKMPFGLAPTDDLDQAKKKLFSGSDEVVETIRGPDGAVLISRLCFANGKGLAFSVMVAFDAAKKLAGVAMASEEEYRKLRGLMEAFRPAN